MTGDYRGRFVSLVERLRSRPLAAVLNDPDLAEQTALFRRDEERFRAFLQAHSTLHDKVVVTDFRALDNPPIGNRFLVYSVFPQSNVWLRIQWDSGGKLIALNIGHSIFDRSCNIDVGELCRNYGGGGHRGAGGCVLRPMAAELAIHIITEKLRKNL